MPDQEQDQQPKSAESSKSSDGLKPPAFLGKRVGRIGRDSKSANDSGSTTNAG